MLRVDDDNTQLAVPCNFQIEPMYIQLDNDGYKLSFHSTPVHSTNIGEAFFAPLMVSVSLIVSQGGFRL